MLKPLFILVFIGLFLQDIGSAATITKLNAAKKIISINEGTDTGFVKKARVCFYDGANKIGCGTVKAAKNNMASVKAKTDKIFQKLKEGLEVRLDQTPLGAPSGETSTTGTGLASYIRFMGIFPIMNAVTYSNLLYEAPLSQDIQSMWTRDSTVRSVGGGVEFGIGFTNSLLAIGARSRIFVPKKIASDYEDKDKDGFFERYAETVARGQSVGLYLDYYYFHTSFGPLGFMLGNGLDIDRSTVKFSMDQKEDGIDVVNTLYTGTSKLSALFLRTNLLLDFNFGSLGFHFGTSVLVPLTQKSTLTLVATDPFTDQFLTDKSAKEDVQAKLGHQAKVGADLFVAGYYSF